MRRKYDRYPTAQQLTISLFDWVPIRGTVIEPCAGDGDMVKILRLHPDIKKVVTSDLDRGLGYEHGWDYYGDAAEGVFYRTGDMAKLYVNPVYRGVDWLVTNPPFKDAARILESAWGYGVQNIALLLRLTFLEPTTGDSKWYGRKQLLEQLAPYLSDMIVFGSPRPSFTGNRKTDSVTTAWFVWRRGKGAPVKNAGTRLRTVTGWDKRGVDLPDVIKAAGVGDVRSWGRATNS